MRTRPYPADNKADTAVSSRFLPGVHKYALLSLMVPALLTLGYAGISALVATMMLFARPRSIDQTPATLGLDFRDVTFKSRKDHLTLHGWFIPGIMPSGHLTTERTLILLHGMHSNRASSLLLGLSAALASKGFAVLAFDMRGHGASPSAPLSGGIFEQRDVLGAVDFLRTGDLPYPELGRPRAIGGWGDSMGGATMLLAAAKEHMLEAIVADSAFAALLPLIQSGSSIPAIFIPSLLTAVRILYGIDYAAASPVDVMEQIAPRSILLIHGSADNVVPPSNMSLLATAAKTAPHAHIQTWLVEGARHIEAYNLMGEAYVERVATFFAATLGPIE